MTKIIPENKKRSRWPWPTGTLFLFAILALIAWNRNFTHKAADSLTPTERAWLKTHPVIRLAPDPDFPPVEYFTKGGGYDGITADYVALIEKKLGMRIEIVRLRNWDEIIAKAKSRQIDVYVATQNPQRAEYMLFTKPYLEFPVVIITREKVGGPLNLEKLAGMKVSVVSGYAAHDFIAGYCPNLNPDPVSDVRAGLRKISFGLSDAFLESLASASYYIEKEGITNLRVSGESGYSYRMGFCSRKDWPELNSILEKGVAAISDDEKKAIYKKWVPMESKSLFTSGKFQTVLLAAFAAILTVAAGVIAWNRALARQVMLRTAELEKELAERKRMREELERARDGLEKRVLERTAELASTTEALIAVEQEKTLFLNVTDAIVVHYDLEMNILWANRAACESLKMPQKKLRQRHCWEMWHKRREPCTGCPVILARDTRESQEAEMRSPDGKIWFIRGYPVKDKTGRMTGIVEFCQDFTERKQAEEALREANLVVEKSPAVLFRWKSSDVWPVELVSTNIIQFGYERDEFLSGSITYSSIIHPDDLERVTREVHEFCNEQADQFRLEYRIMTKWGNIRWVNEHSNIERDNDGMVAHFEGIIIDVTERKLADEELKRQKQLLQELNDTLERRVEEEVRKNREKDIMLIQQNRQAALGEMLDHIAHQWKQPLNSISLIVQEMAYCSSDGELTDERVQATNVTIMSLLDHMAQTIDVFRGFYRPDKETKNFSIKDSINQAITFIAPAFKYQSIATELDIDPELTAFGYPREFAQVLLNILANARDAFKARETENPRVNIRAFSEGTKTVVTIADNAGGIPEEIKDKIFDFYFTTNESSGCTGIGLYMSKNIIEKNMCGTLSAENRDDGARFIIEIPSA